MTEGLAYSSSWLVSYGSQLIVGYFLPNYPITSHILSATVGSLVFYTFSGMNQAFIDNGDNGKYLSNIISASAIFSLAGASYIYKSDQLNLAKTLTTTSAFTFFAFPLVTFDPYFTPQTNMTLEEKLIEGEVIATTCSYVGFISIVTFGASQKHTSSSSMLVPLVSLAVSNAGELLAYDKFSATINNGTLNSWYVLTGVNLVKSGVEAFFAEDGAKKSKLLQSLVNSFFSYISLWFSRPIFYSVKDGANSLLSSFLNKDSKEEKICRQVEQEEKIVKNLGERDLFDVDEDVAL